MLCEICGKKRAETKIHTDGVNLQVCETCTKFGREIQTRSEPKTITRSLPAFAKEDLLPNYSDLLKKARQEKGWTLKEVATKLMEKEKIIQRVESGKMFPDNSLIKKLEKLFSIKLTGIVSAFSFVGFQIPPQ